MKRAKIDPYDGPTTPGIDVSAYQPDIDWPRVRSSGVRWAAVRTGDGTQTRKGSAADPWAVRHLSGASAAGLSTACYHYVRAYRPAHAQVDVILDVIKVSGVRPGFIALDIEGSPKSETGAWWRPDGAMYRVSTSDVIECAGEMIRLLNQSGHRVVIYTGVAWHWHIAQTRSLEGGDWFVDCDLWTPYYTSGDQPALPVGPQGEPYPWREWTIWQHSAKGTVPGVAGPVDLNRFRGDEAACIAYFTPAVAKSFDRSRIKELSLEAANAGDEDAAQALMSAYLWL